MKKKANIVAKVCDILGVRCVVRKTEMKVYTGYVGLEPGHPLFGAEFPERESELSAIDVHGGITYAADRLPWWKPDGKWWLGFHCAHDGDAIPGLAEDEDRVYRDESFAQKEVVRLAKKLIGIAAEMN